MRGRANIQVVLIALLAIFTPHLLKAEDLIEYFNFAKYSPITIKSGYAKLNFIGGFADGKYEVSNYTIKPYAKNIYILKVYLKKKKHHFTYKSTVEFAFYMHKNIIAFKTIKGRLIFHFPEDLYFIKKVKGGYLAEKINPTIEVKLPLNNGYLFLNIEKNR